MKKIFAVMTLGVLMSTPILATATPLAPASALDLSLMEAGVIGQDYKYKNPKVTAQVFSELNKQLNANLPMMTAEGMQATSVSITPYKSTYVHSYTMDIAKDKASALKKEIGSPAVLSKLCSEVFLTERFLSANNHRMTFRYQLKNGKKLVDVKMNNATCTT